MALFTTSIFSILDAFLASQLPLHWKISKLLKSNVATRTEFNNDFKIEDSGVAVHIEGQNTTLALETASPKPEFQVILIAFIFFGINLRLKGTKHLYSESSENNFIT